MMHPSRQAYVEEAEDTDMGISLADLRRFLPPLLQISSPILLIPY